MTGVFRIIGPQIGRYQLVTTEHIQRQKTVGRVLAVGSGSRLFTVDQIIGAVKIQNQLGRWRRKGFDENLRQYPTDVPKMYSSCRVVVSRLD